MPLRTMTPEAQLVFASAGGEAAADRVRALAARPLHWERVGELARFELAAPAVHGLLQRHASDRVPATFLDALAREARAARLRASYLAHRAEAACLLLESRGIAAVLLKGAAMVRAVYRSPAERAMSDIDVLVHPDDARRARALLLEGGWLPGSATQPDAAYAAHFHLPPVRDARAPDIALELHVGLLPSGAPYRLEAAAVMARARPDAQGVRLPAAPDLAVHCAVHLAWSHMFSQGGWQAFRDVRELTDRGAIGWSGIAEAADAAGARGACYWWLRLASVVACIPVPEQVMAQLRPRMAEWRRRRLERFLARMLDAWLRGTMPIALARRLWQRALADDLGRADWLPPWEGGDAFVGPGSDEQERHRNRHLLAKVQELVEFGPVLLGS